MTLMQSNVDDEFDLIIIGSGLYGIVAARYYLEVHQNSHVVILESDDVVGGTWSTKRIYDGFWTQTPLGMAELSDVPIQLPPGAQTYHGFYPAAYVADYLEKYVDSHVYGGRSLRQRVRFRQPVSWVEKETSGKWRVHCDSSRQIFRAAKLIVASGLTSTSHEPVLPNREVFCGKIIHQKSLGQITPLIDHPEWSHIAVLGGGKSAADAVYSAVKSGKSVSWIIRQHGCGPSAHASAKGLGLYDNSVEMFNTRLVSSFSPSIFRRQSIWDSLLHRTKIGRSILDRIWKTADKQNRGIAGYRTRQAETEAKGFEKLEPDTPFFWQNDGSGISQHADFWSTIAKNVRVYRSDISSLRANGIELCDSSFVPADLLICATGWESSLSFFSSEAKVKLGLPVLISEYPTSSALYWQTLDNRAQEHVLRRFPGLANPPRHYESERVTTPYRLYKSVAPLDADPTIVFLGHIHVGNNFMTAESQALWALAYLDGRLDLPSSDAMATEIAMTNAWCRLRYLDKGMDGNFFYFDLIPYVDMLLRHVGVKSHVQSWPRNQTAPLMARDLKLLCQEYIAGSRDHSIVYTSQY